MPETLTGKYLRADILPPDPKKKTRRYVVSEIDTRFQLGMIRWYGPWRGYCFYPHPLDGTVFDGGCLMQISDWLYELNAAHKLEKEASK